MGAKISSLFSDLRAWASPGPSSNALALVLLTYVAGVMIGVLAETKDTVALWNTTKKAAYLATAVLTLALLGAGLMAAAERFKNPDVSVFCAKLGTILSSALFVIAISCKIKPWGCTAGVASAAVVACVMAAVWVWAEPGAREAIRGCWSRIWKTR